MMTFCTPCALWYVAEAIVKQGADFVYTDEVTFEGDIDHLTVYHFKPDYMLDNLRSNNYICHFFVVQKSIVEKAGGFRKEFDGAQDYDFIFRCTENAGEVLHVPEILYHWRTHKASTADNPASKMYAFEAGKRAIEAHLERTGTKGEVSHTQDLGFYRVKYPVQGNLWCLLSYQTKTRKRLFRPVWKCWRRIPVIRILKLYRGE